MNLQELIGGKLHYTDIPDELRKDIKTERQWAKKGFVAVSEECGIFLWANYFHNGWFKYLHVSEVRKAAQEELDALFSDEKQRRNQNARKYRLKKIQEQEQERRELSETIGELEQALERVHGELRNGKRGFQELCKILCSKLEICNVPTSDVIVIDTETTGFSAKQDELLQVSILDGNTGSTLFHSYVKPSFAGDWEDAEKINGIGPQTVQDAPFIFELLPAINSIVSKAKMLIGYNTSFDRGFLETYGVDFSSVETFVDVMEDFAVVYGDYNEYHNSFTWKDLETCAAYFGYDWGEDTAHDSLADCKATLYCYNELQKEEYIQTYKNNMKMMTEFEC